MEDMKKETVKGNTTVRPVLGQLTFGAKKLFIAPAFIQNGDGKYKDLMIFRKIEGDMSISKEAILNEELFAYAALNFKSKKSITNFIRILREFRDKTFGKTPEELMEIDEE